MTINTGELRVKICGITQPAQAAAIVRLGADSLGFICVPQSPRFVNPAQIQAIVSELPIHPKTGQKVGRIGVFANASLEQITQTIGAGLTGIQLHGSETPEFCRQVQLALPQIELVKALRIRTPKDLAQIPCYQDAVDMILLDAYIEASHPGLLGGTGKTLDWEALRSYKPDCNWLLAGGLTPDNVLVALRQLRPSGIDLSSGVERSPGDKDLRLVAQLFSNLQQWQKLRSSL